MCGYLGNVIQDPLYKTLIDLLQAKDQLNLEFDNPGSGPAASINIIHAAEQGSVSGERQLDKAIWWLLLEKQTDGGLKPSKYTSFNTRSDKLNVPRSAGFNAYRESRCIIPATYIIEGEGTKDKGAKNHRRYHRIEPKHCGFALAGLYRNWLDESTGEELKSCSVITVPPSPEWQGVHSKSTPLFLSAHNAELIAQWLDPAVQDIEVFDYLFEPLIGLRGEEELIATPIDRPGSQQVTGEAKVLLSL